jgi:capsule polysaccharide export protein KpsE/RkpR
MRTRPLKTLARSLIRFRRLVYANVLLFTLAAVILSLVLPERYTANASLMPLENPEPTLPETLTPMELGMYTSGRLFDLSDFANASYLSMSLMERRAIREPVIRENGLLERYGAKTYEEASRIFDRMVLLDVSMEGIVQISVSERDPKLAAEIANDLIDQLDRFHRRTLRSAGRTLREHVEERIARVRDEQRRFEAELKALQEEKGSLLLDEEIREMLEAYARVQAKRVRLEMERDVLRRISSPDHPGVVRLDREIAGLTAQLGRMETGSEFGISLEGLPAARIEHLRLLREVEVRNTVLEYLTGQLEIARLMESRDTPALEIIDPAVAPRRKSWPNRKLFVLFSALSAVALSAFLSLHLDRIRGVKSSENQRDGHPA